MTRISSVRIVAWTFYVFAFVTAGSSALATDLVVDSSVLFSALDGSASDEDGIAIGILTLNSLVVTGSVEIVRDVPVADFVVSGNVKLEGNGAVHPDPSSLPVAAPTVNIKAASSIVVTGTSPLAADGASVGGALFICAAEKISSRDARARRKNAANPSLLLVSRDT